MTLNYYLYLDVKVISTGEIGMVIDTNEDQVLVEFEDGSREWCYPSDIVEVTDKEC